MEIYCAPLEGVTGSLYRRAHAALFSGVDVYYIPFLTPREGTLFDRHDLREADPEENRGIPTIPPAADQPGGRLSGRSGAAGGPGLP